MEHQESHIISTHCPVLGMPYVLDDPSSLRAPVVLSCQHVVSRLAAYQVSFVVVCCFCCLFVGFEMNFDSMR